MERKFLGLDHLRTLAIISVFLFHYYIVSGGKPEWLLKLASFGWTGVDLFFVLSGFLISSQLFAQIKAGKLISFKEFFVKRFFRILPPFLFTVALYFAVPFFREKESLPPVWKFLIFTQNFGLNIKDFGTFSHAWSLCVEEHFYLLLPIILFILQYFRKMSLGFWLIILLFIGGFLLRLFSYIQLYLPYSNEETSWLYWYKFIYYPTYNRLDGLLVGVAIAGIYQFLPNFWAKIERLGNFHFVLGIVVLTLAYFLCEDQMTFSASVFGFPIIAVGYGFFVMGAVSKKSFLYRWNSRVSSWIAKLSYAIYLTHKGVVHTTIVLLKDFKLNENLVLVVGFLMCILDAFLVHIFIEKPFMNLRSKILNKK